MKAIFRKKEETFSVELKKSQDDFVMEWLEQSGSGRILGWGEPCFEMEWEGQRISGTFYRSADWIDVHLPQGNFRLFYEAKQSGSRKAHHEPGQLTAPMPGKVLKVLVQEGDGVQKGDTLMILEAMKMEHQVLSPLDGKVKKILFQEGDRVSQEDELVEVEEGS